MNYTKRKEITLKSAKVKFDNIGRPAGLARSHKLIMVDNIREEQLLRLCSQIRFDDSREDRAECQREQRKMRRKTVQSA